PGEVIPINVGCSLETTYMNPRSGSTADLPQLVPPLWPGISIEPFMLGGVNNPSLRQPLKASRNASFSASGMKGLMSFSVKDCRANAGGFVGNGCVGEENSPGTSDCGTLRSSMGQSGSPVLRLKTKRKPCLVACATA